MFNRSVLIVAVMLSLLCATAYAGSVGLSYSEILEDRSLGITGDYATDLTDRVAFESDAQVQIGDVYNGVLNTNFVFDVSVVDLKLLISNKAKGYTLDSLGREQNVGLAFTVPINDLNIDVGVGGSNSNPFAAPSAYDTLTAAGFAEGDLDEGLKSITPTPVGLPLGSGSALNAFVATGFTRGVFDITAKGIVQLVSEDDKIHTGVFNIKTGGKIYGMLATVAVEVGVATYRQEIHYETGVITSIGYEF